jgi:hypothetical protein
MSPSQAAMVPINTSELFFQIKKNCSPQRPWCSGDLSLAAAKQKRSGLQKKFGGGWVTPYRRRRVKGGHYHGDLSLALAGVWGARQQSGITPQRA